MSGEGRELSLSQGMVHLKCRSKSCVFYESWSFYNASLPLLERGHVQGLVGRVELVAVIRGTPYTGIHTFCLVWLNNANTFTRVHDHFPCCALERVCVHDRHMYGLGSLMTEQSSPRKGRS
jgi:hypothetical protein